MFLDRGVKRWDDASSSLTHCMKKYIFYNLNNSTILKLIANIISQLYCLVSWPWIKSFTLLNLMKYYWCNNSLKKHLYITEFSWYRNIKGINYYQDSDSSLFWMLVITDTFNNPVSREFGNIKVFLEWIFTALIFHQI